MQLRGDERSGQALARDVGDQQDDPAVGGADHVGVISANPSAGLKTYDDVEPLHRRRAGDKTHLNLTRTLEFKITDACRFTVGPRCGRSVPLRSGWLRTRWNGYFRTRLRGLEAVANIADGLNQGRLLRIRLDLVPQGRDAPIHAATGDDDLMAPDLVDDIRARQRPVGAAQEIGEHAELFGGERDFFAVLDKPV